MDAQWNPISSFQTSAQQQGGSNQAQFIPTPDHEINVARNQMFESVQNLSASLRNAASQCDNFVKVLSRHQASASSAANAFANNVGADFLSLASGTNLGAHSLAAAAAAVGAGNSGTNGLTLANLANIPKRQLSKEDRKALRKQRKLNRDPNAPKRPPSAYLLFQNEIREEMRQQFKDLSYPAILGKISEAWKSLPEEQRKVYNDRTMDHMASWNQQKREMLQDSTEYVDDGTDVGHVDPATAAAAAAAAAAQQFTANGLMAIPSPRGRKPGSKNKKSKKA